jgi:hypothetical protein
MGTRGRRLVRQALNQRAPGILAVHGLTSVRAYAGRGAAQDCGPPIHPCVGVVRLNYVRAGPLVYGAIDTWWTCISVRLALH